ncbi:MAG: hypothetical protein KDB07_08550, partial [Planctomycetes bacterium]|nr:hypothetical protein [Planctomycetota bacterium]
LSLLLAFSAAFVMAPMAFAQDVDKEKTKEELKGKSDQQLKEELDGLTKDISKGMDKVKKGLNEAALPRRKADELRVELEAALEKLKKGEAEELHKGLREYLGENPDKLAELLKLQRDEAVKLLEDDAALLKKLSENADKAADLMKDVEALEDVLKRQEAIEKSMEEVKDALKKGESTENHIERVLDILQEAKRRAKP